jgi:hypothetical protein
VGSPEETAGYPASQHPALFPKDELLSPALRRLIEDRTADKP